MGPTTGAVVAAFRRSCRRPRHTGVIAVLGWVMALATGTVLWGLLTLGQGRVSVALLTLLLVGVAAGSLALGNAVLVAVVLAEGDRATAGPRDVLRAGLAAHFGAAGRSSLLLVGFVLPAMVVAGLLAATLVPNAFLRTSHGAGTGAPALAFLGTFEPGSFAVLVTVLLGDWVAPTGVHATVATVTLLVLTPVRFVDVAGSTGAGPFGLVDSLGAVSARPVSALAYAITRLVLLGVAVALVWGGGTVGMTIAGPGGRLLGALVASALASVVVYPIAYRFHLGWYERVRPTSLFTATADTQL